MDRETLFERLESQYEDDPDWFIDIIYDEFAEYCMEHNISEEDLSNETLEAMAKDFIEAGFNTVE